MPLTSFADSESFFVEWRMITDNPAWLIEEWQVPTVVVAGGNGPGFYHTVMTADLVRLLRSLSLPLVFAEIEPGTAHAYRLELFGDQLYVMFVDGEIVETGVPEGAYPDPTARLLWGAEVTHDDAPNAASAWDYVRAGRIPQDASGDYNNDEAHTLIDHYFIVDCLTKDGPGIFGGPGNAAGPGCRFADFDSDADVDLLDFAAFQNTFSG